MISREEVGKIASLAQLELSEKEKELFTSQLGEILEYIGLLNSLDTSGETPSGHVFSGAAPLLPDEAAEFADAGLITGIAPEYSENLYRVKKVIE